MAAMFGLRRFAHSLLATAAVGALVAAPALRPPAAAADPSGPSGPTVPSVTSGAPGKIVWSQLILNSSTGGVEAGYLRSSDGYSYFHDPDPDAILRDPEWSPDGTRIAYWAYNANAGAQGIWAVDHPFHAERAVQVTRGYSDTDPTWSPDGTKIAFVRTQGDNGIYVVDAKGGGTPVQVLRGSFYGEDLTWSPDGTKIAFANFSGGAYTSPMHVYVMDADGSTPIDLGLGQAPSWRPDGNRIAFEFPYTSTDWDIAWMNPDGSGRQTLLNGSINEREPGWSPDGKKMAFLRSDGIWAYDWTTGGQTIVSAGSNYESTTWGADQPACQGRAATISGTSGPDTLYGSNGVDVISGLGGDDTIVGRQGQDVICGGAGVDTVSYAGQYTPVTAYVGETDPNSGVSDLIAGDVENLDGGSGPDVLVGPGVLHGGDGADILTGDYDGAILYGGFGDDRLVGGLGNDSLFGDGGDDVLVGDEGDDAMSGGSGDDILRGGADVDQLDGGFDADVLVGGSGIDTVTYGTRTIWVNVTIGGGGDDDGSRQDGTVDERDRVRGSVENVVGGAGGDLLIGNEADNDLTGGLGADEMHGGDGTDRLRAQDGIKDRIIDCGDGTDYNAIKDGGGIDPPAISCP